MLSKKAKKNVELNEAIAEVFRQMQSLTADSTEYATMVDQLQKLYAIRDSKESKNSTELKDWLPIIGSMSGVLVIVAFEAFGHTMTSKAMTFVTKPRS